MFGVFPSPTRMKRHTWRLLDQLKHERMRERRSTQCGASVVQILQAISDNQGALRIMAGRKKTVESGGTWEGFARIELSDADKERFAEWELNDEDVFVLMADLIGSGYKLSLSFSDQNNSYICALTCRDPQSPNAGYTSSSFAQTWYQALRVMLFKHMVVCEGDWGKAKLRPTGNIG